MNLTNIFAIFFHFRNPHLLHRFIKFSLYYVHVRRLRGIIEDTFYGLFPGSLQCFFITLGTFYDTFRTKIWLEMKDTFNTRP